MHGRKLFWRLRHNPLKRGVDVLQAWIGVLTVLLMAGGAISVGALTAHGVASGAEHRGDELRAAPAVVVKDAPDPPATTAGVGLVRMSTTVRWTTPDGTVHTGRAQVLPGSRAGAAATVWLDGSGKPQAKPAGSIDAWTEGAVVGLGAAAAAAGTTWCGYLLVRRTLDRIRLAGWEREWAEIGPRWNQRSSS